MNGTMVIGLTGGIGSGKSTAADCFRAFGIPVLDADLYSRSALQPNTPCFVKTVALFGTKCLLPDGTVDRRFIATRIFSDAVMREQLNGIIHPYVLKCLREETAGSSAKRIIWEVPLLFESGFDRYCARTVAVLCAEEIRTERICLRDHTTKEQALSRIRAQMTDAERAARADDVLYNEGSVQALRHAVAKLVKTWEELG